MKKTIYSMVFDGAVCMPLAVRRKPTSWNCGIHNLQKNG